MRTINSWIAVLRSRAGSANRAAAAETGMLDFYNEELDAIGDVVQCWRLSGERDDAYRHRLALHLQEHISQLEDALARLLRPGRTMAQFKEKSP